MTRNAALQGGPRSPQPGLQLPPHPGKALHPRAGRILGQLAKIGALPAPILSTAAKWGIDQLDAHPAVHRRPLATSCHQTGLSSYGARATGNAGGVLAGC
jgi:hypothetical protein